MLRHYIRWLRYAAAMLLRRFAYARYDDAAVDDAIRRPCLLMMLLLFTVTAAVTLMPFRHAARGHSIALAPMPSDFAAAATPLRRHATLR